MKEPNEVSLRLHSGGETLGGSIEVRPLNLVLGLCDEIHVLDFGRLIASGPPGRIRNEPAVTEAYLGATASSDAGAAPEPAIGRGARS